MTIPSARPPVTRAVGEAARHDYVATPMTVAEILRKHKISQSALYRWLEGGPYVNGERMFPPVERRSPTRRRQSEREKLVQRLWRAASSQVRKLETRLIASPEPDENNARAMAVLVKTLRDLSDLDSVKPKSKPIRGNEPAPEVNDDPRHIDEFRRELARRIAALDPAPTGETDRGA